jgi:hypothetical protein
MSTNKRVLSFLDAPAVRTMCSLLLSEQERALHIYIGENSQSEVQQCWAQHLLVREGGVVVGVGVESRVFVCGPTIK